MGGRHDLGHWSQRSKDEIAGNIIVPPNVSNLRVSNHRMEGIEQGNIAAVSLRAYNRLVQLCQPPRAYKLAGRTKNTSV